MEHPIRQAFCKLLFADNGGEFDEKGMPIFNRGDRRAIRGKCDKPYDCGECPLLHKWVDHLMSQGWEISWECQGCLRETLQNGDVRQLPGYYQSSKYRGSPEEYIEAEPDKAIDGCTRCGYGTAFLQLVLRGGPNAVLPVR